MKQFRLVLILALFPLCQLKAEIFSLPQLTPTETDSVLRTLASTLFFKPIEPASGYGKIWGLGVGVSASFTKTTAVQGIFQNSSAQYLPNAEINGGITLPMGITIEGGYLPSLTYTGTRFNKWAVGGKLTLTRFFSKAPIDIAVRGGITKGTLFYSQTSGGPNVDVDYSTSILTANVIISKSFILFEPFAGIGIAQHNSTLTGTGAGTIFGTGYPALTTTTTASSTSLWMHAGFLLNLQVLRLSASVDQAFGIVSFNGKVSFSI